ncbi:tRNA adenosine(34) deaminase TadA [Psychrosphaera sp.]|nr:tRNA adenosine(34) deaminase TadA [Psychrosphaera sp.]
MTPTTKPFKDLSSTDEMFMRHALQLAKKAEAIGEIPVGAVLVRNGKVIAEGYNQAIALNDPTAHAEVMALRAAGEVCSNYRLVETTLYVTLEPCVMCSGSMVHARVSRLVYGAKDYKTGAVESVMKILDHDSHNHKVTSLGGVLEEECSTMLSAFFKRRRAEKKDKKKTEKLKQAGLRSD